MNLIADIGATNSRYALIEEGGRIIASQAYLNKDFDRLQDGLESYLKQHSGPRPQRVALAVAAPIFDDHVEMFNRDWSFSRAQLQRDFGFADLIVINDFGAVAWALPSLKASEATKIGRGKPRPHAPLAALGPGSGLGVASIAPTPDDWAVIEGEGGHATLAATTDEETEILAIVRQKHGHCSAERILSGPGLVELHQALGQLAGRPQEAIQPSEVTARAATGDPHAVATLDHFFAFLGNFAGNLALTVGAHGGIFIAGGIVPRLVTPLGQSTFRQCFEGKGRYQAYLARIPTWVITTPVPAFLGLRVLLARPPKH